MTIRRVTCPGCGAAANVPMAMANVKCPACGMVWNVNQSVAETPSSTARPTREEAAETPESAATGTAALIAGLIGGAMFLVAMVGVLLVVLNRNPDPAQVSVVEPEETIKPARPAPYREINLPEEQRRRIYNDYRQVARTTVEKPLVLPQGTQARALLEDTLDKTFERELTRFAALHDISVDDVREVIKEGDAKVWDDSPRSNAVRDGKRVYPKEMSEGWQPNPNRK